ncbi:hypothetical protein [Dactylosporangium sp. NPDC049140]|uniref:hypothetical protein n=1 Tax=Dactylosporangium sp. NPDC049140 TaxID=3155647 RepID=UPI0033E3E06B
MGYRKDLMLLAAVLLALAGSGAVASATLREPVAGIREADARQGLSPRRCVVDPSSCPAAGCSESQLFSVTL